MKCIVSEVVADDVKGDVDVVAEVAEENKRD